MRTESQSVVPLYAGHGTRVAGLEASLHAGGGIPTSELSRTPPLANARRELCGLLGRRASVEIALGRGDVAVPHRCLDLYEVYTVGGEKAAVGVP